MFKTYFLQRCILCQIAKTERGRLSRVVVSNLNFWLPKYFFSRHCLCVIIVFLGHVKYTLSSCVCNCLQYVNVKNKRCMGHMYMYIYRVFKLFKRFKLGFYGDNFLKLHIILPVCTFVYLIMIAFCILMDVI